MIVAIYMVDLYRRQYRR